MDVPQETLNELHVVASEAFTNAAQNVATLSVAAYLNRQNMAVWLGCSPAYLDSLVRQGLPVTEVNGHRMYYKQAAVQWLKQFER
jgi:hypothetical protein